MNEEHKKVTIGKLAYDLMVKPQESHNPNEHGNAMLTTFDDDFYSCIKENSKKYTNNNFYIVVITKREPIMNVTLRNYFFARKTCPTPDYDQAVFYYNRSEQSIDFLWVIPDREVCIHLIINALHVAPAEKELLNFVIDYKEGTLSEIAKKRNKEMKYSDLLED